MVEHAKKKTAKKAAPAAAPRARKSRTAPAEPLTVTADAIARRAFELYVASGGADGHDLEHWLQAERDLRATS